ncbi:uncharacterized protein K02A2.6-like [Octopus bimaculoides]|uniref:uncharacterized protein K02A2.6-like n=1 Tax=Octopus bimaculoides TaxID=37653 RepID=UPI00071C34F6|nr:uncharacterized protein K02A2.6-like [Octopus bimaculoides]|eukprot:XP_014786441.1 PREDICTED: uncharacterized protein K02A2.6-like [Octopus bimaculoides]
MSTSLQGRMLKEFHTGHPGISRMKLLLRSYVYCLKMDLDIEKLVKSCRGCALAAKSPLIKFQSWLKTDIPWFRLQINFTGPLNRPYYLIAEDRFSKWPEMCKCRKLTPTVTVEFLQELFARYGVLDTIVSDNGTQFTVNKFKNF